MTTLREAALATCPHDWAQGVDLNSSARAAFEAGARWGIEEAAKAAETADCDYGCWEITTDKIRALLQPGREG